MDKVISFINYSGAIGLTVLTGMLALGTGFTLPGICAGLISLAAGVYVLGKTWNLCVEGLDKFKDRKKKPKFPSTEKEGFKPGAEATA